MPNANATHENKRGRDSESPDLDIPEPKRLKDDDLLISSYEKADLDFLLSSFDTEISVSQTPIESFEIHPDLGYLLEASDDELGLPPSNTSEVVSGNEEPEPNGDSIGEMWRFDDQIPCFDSLEINNSFADDNNREYVAFDGLFDYSDEVIQSADGGRTVI